MKQFLYLFSRTLRLNLSKPAASFHKLTPLNRSQPALITIIALLSLLVVVPLALAQGGFTPFQLQKTEIQPAPDATRTATNAFPFSTYRSADFFFPPYHSETDRYGYGKASGNSTDQLNAGWYVDWNIANNAPHPGGAEFVHTIYFQIQNTAASNCPAPGGGFYPGPAITHDQVKPIRTDSQILAAVALNPGALWLVGNEPDSLYNGSPIQAEIYAELYHHYYTLIKTADPTAKIAIGAIVQPSPLRMAYLDKILTHYQTTYGSPMPIDVWNIHFYRLNEQECSWGATIPPFGNPADAWIINWEDYDLLDVPRLEQILRDFRVWMRDRGYRDTPLIITEYGVLAPPTYGIPQYTNENAAIFLRNSFQMLRTSADAATGYTADSNRLVQAWSWFSTYHTNFGGDLFDDPLATTPNVIGQAFINEATTTRTNYADAQLIVQSFTATTTALDFSAFAHNRGNTVSQAGMATVTLTDESGQQLAETLTELGQLPRRYQETPKAITAAWQVENPQAPTLTYTLAATITSPGDVDTGNNVYTSQFLWTPVTDLGFAPLHFSTGNPFVYTTPVTATMLTTVTNRGNFTSSVTSVTVQADGQTVRVAPLPALAPQQTHTITATIPITQAGATQLNLTIAAGNPEFQPQTTQAENLLLAASTQVYLPLVLR